MIHSPVFSEQKSLSVLPVSLCSETEYRPAAANAAQAAPLFITLIHYREPSGICQLLLTAFSAAQFSEERPEIP